MFRKHGGLKRIILLVTKILKGLGLIAASMGILIPLIKLLPAITQFLKLELTLSLWNLFVLIFLNIVLLSYSLYLRFRIKELEATIMNFSTPVPRKHRPFEGWLKR